MQKMEENAKNGSQVNLIKGESFKKIKRFSCNVCGKLLGDKRDFRGSHTNSYWWECGQGFRQKSAFNVHMKIHWG